MGLFRSYLLMLESFKDAKSKWMINSNGAPEDVIDDYIKKFKVLKDNNYIKNFLDKDIGSWMNKSFSDFKEFVDKLEKVGKHVSVYGSKEVIEILDNEYCTVFVPKNYKASREFGSSDWCITYGEKYWNDYINENGLTPYFILFKPEARYVVELTSKYANNMKWCVMIDTHGYYDSIWDADDNQIEEDEVLGIADADEVSVTDVFHFNHIDIKLFKSRVASYEEDVVPEEREIDYDGIDSFMEWYDLEYQLMDNLEEVYEQYDLPVTQRLGMSRINAWCSELAVGYKPDNIAPFNLHKLKMELHKHGRETFIPEEESLLRDCYNAMLSYFVEYYAVRDKETITKYYIV